jgi:hypothetical protein
MNSVTVHCGCGREILKYADIIIKERKTWTPDIEGERSLRVIFDDLKLLWCCRMELTAMVTLPDILYDIPVNED